MKPKFEFDSVHHYYTLGGKRMYGVTSVLGVIAKNALIPWASKMACEYVREHLKSMDEYVKAVGSAEEHNEELGV